MWQPSLRTIKTPRPFALIIPLLGIASNRVIQKKKKQPTDCLKRRYL